MKMKTLGIKTIAVCFALLLLNSSVSVAATKLKPSRKLGNIARIDAAITSKQHYRQHPVDDEISEMLFDEYFKVLDPNKMYFTKEQIRRFAKYEKRLDDLMNAGNVDFAFDVYNKFVENVKAHEEFAKRQIRKGFDFNKNETFVIDRSEADWPMNAEEREELWRRKIKNDILTYRLMERAETERKKEEGKEKQSSDSGAEKKVGDDKPEHSSWRKCPKERMLNRLSSYVNLLEQNSPIDVLELYLSSFKKVYDPHSAYMSPDTEEDFNISMKLSLVGIGALLSSEDGYTKIVKLIAGGPAERDGQLKANDRIVAVAQDGEDPVDIIDMPLNKVVRLIRGKKNTKVHLTILRGSKGAHAIPEVVVLTRDEVKLKEQEVHGRTETLKTNDDQYKIGVITIPSFYLDFQAAAQHREDYKSSTRDVRRILEDFKKKGGVDGLIVDVRSNGGGSLLEAIKLTGLFIRTGPVVQVRSHDGDVMRKNDPDSEIYYEGPLIVMTNRFSASAAEIFAGAIQDYHRGVVVGDSHTHGKGTVQTIYDLSDFLNFFGSNEKAGSLKLTTAKFYRISGSSTQERGVIPDIIFPSFSDSMDVGEAYLEHALPWDRIDPNEHDDYGKNLPVVVSTLRIRSEERQRASREFQALAKNLDYYKRLKDRKELSLNEDERWKSYLEDKRVIEEQNRLLKLDEESDEKKDDNQPESKRDVYFKETMNVMADWLQSRKGTGNSKSSTDTPSVCEKSNKKPENP